MILTGVLVISAIFIGWLITGYVNLRTGNVSQLVNTVPSDSFLQTSPQETFAEMNPRKPEHFSFG